jgi:hypothetical protein
MPTNDVPPERPGLMHRAVSYAEALARWTAAGRPERSDKELERIFSQHCTTCNWYDPPEANLPGLRLPGRRERLRCAEQDQDGHRKVPARPLVTPMPCDCCEDQPRPIPAGGCNYLVYSGGPPASFYRLVEQAIPDVEMAHGRPTGHPDGSLEFRGPPPALVGYRPEGQRLYPAWPPCTSRILRVEVMDGTLGIAGNCGSPEAEQFSRDVTVEQCQDCPVCRRPFRDS